MSKEMIVILAMFAVAGLTGAVAGLVLATVAAKSMLQRWLPSLPEFVAFREIKFVSNIAIAVEKDGSAADIEHAASASFIASGINAEAVGNWLDKRDLVMAPKGRDFKPASPVARNVA